MFSGRLTLSAVFDTPDGDGLAVAAAVALAFQRESSEQGECRILNEMTFSVPAAV